MKNSNENEFEFLKPLSRIANWVLLEISQQIIWELKPDGSPAIYNLEELENSKGYLSILPESDWAWKINSETEVVNGS